MCEAAHNCYQSDFEVLAPFDILWANFEVDGKKINFNQLMMRRTKRVCLFFVDAENQPSHFYNLIFIGDFNGDRNSENRFVQV